MSFSLSLSLSWTVGKYCLVAAALWDVDHSVCHSFLDSSSALYFKVYVCVCVYVCMYVCMYVRMYVLCMYARACVRDITIKFANSSR